LQIALQLLEDVAQTGRHSVAGRHRKRQALGLAFAVVRVLAEDDDPHLISRRQLQRAQDTGGVDHRARDLPRRDEILELSTCGRCAPFPNDRRP